METAPEDKSPPRATPEDAGPAAPNADRAKSHRGDPADTLPQREIGGREGPEPTRYGDWEVNGICSDF